MCVVLFMHCCVLYVLGWVQISIIRCYVALVVLYVCGVAFVGLYCCCCVCVCVLLCLIKIIFVLKHVNHMVIAVHMLCLLCLWQII